MLTVASEVESRLEKKRSIFIGRLSPVESDTQAQEWISRVRKLHPDATHHCYAYIIGDRGEVQRSNDDGEPSGTAGKPILETLKKRGLTNVAAVVTRFFGGTLLGAGGLVRAYSESVSEALRAAALVEVVNLYGLEVRVGYAWWEQLQHMLKEERVSYDPPVFAAEVTLRLYLREEEIAAFQDNLMELTRGQARLIKHAEIVRVRRPVARSDA